MGEGTLKATVSLYGGHAYLNIRVYYDDKATKQGITVGRMEWNAINLVLDHGPEMSLARTCYSDMFQEAVQSMKSSLCQGCVHQQTNKSLHDCMTSPKSLNAEALAANPHVDVFDFIERAATAGARSKITLTRPVDMFNVCDRFYRLELEKALEARYSKDE